MEWRGGSSEREVLEENENPARGHNIAPRNAGLTNAVISSQLLSSLDRSAVLGNANGCSLPWVFHHQWRVIIFGNNQYWIVKPQDKVAGRAFKQSLTSMGLKADGWISWD